MNTPTKRCTKCGETKPLIFFGPRPDRGDGIQTQCRACTAKKSKKWRDNHPDQFKEANRKNSLRWQKENPEKKRARDKRYRKKNRDKECDRQRRYYKDHPEKSVANAQRRIARKRKQPSSFTGQDWNRCLNYWNGACAYCGRGPSLFDVFGVLHQEHHIPVNPDYELTVPNPGYAAVNIIPACQSCNLSKGNKDPRSWVQQYFGAKKANIILIRIQRYFEWVEQQHE